MPIRTRLIEKAKGKCVACDRRFTLLDCHEILNGPLRVKTLGEPCSLLVLCWQCNSMEFTDKELWPIARQLALLQAWNPEDYDLTRFCWLRNENAPNYIVQSQVDEYANQFTRFQPAPAGNVNRFISSPDRRTRRRKRCHSR